MALHVRGACYAPERHSLGNAWRGPTAFHHLYPKIGSEWIPIAEDCVGDQFFLFDSRVLRLYSETGEVKAIDLSLWQLIGKSSSDPVEFSSMHPLLRFQHDNGALEPGQLILAYPPFATEEAANGVSLAAVPARELHEFHAEFASKFAAGSRVHLTLKD